MERDVTRIRPKAVTDADPRGDHEMTHAGCPLKNCSVRDIDIGSFAFAIT